MNSLIQTARNMHMYIYIEASLAPEIDFKTSDLVFQTLNVPVCPIQAVDTRRLKAIISSRVHSFFYYLHATFITVSC